MVDTESLYLWSKTAASNDVADGGINWQEGQTPGSVNASARSMMAAVAKYLADINGTQLTAGSSNAYTLASPATSHSSLINGLIIKIRASFTNTGACTFNLSSIGAKKILDTAALGDLAAGQIIVNGHYSLEYDSSADSSNGAWICLNPSVRAGTMEEFYGTTLPAGYLWPDGSTFSAVTWPALNAVLGGTTLPDKRGRVGIGKDNIGGTPAGRITNAECGIVGTTLLATGGVQSLALSSGQLPVVTPTGTVTVTGTINGNGANLSLSISDPGHVHGLDGTTLYSQGLFNTSSGGNIKVATNAGTNTASNTTGISGTLGSNAIAGNLTWAASTQTFSGNSFGSGSTHNNVQPGIICNFIIKAA